jgi:hypothetical protein
MISQKMIVFWILLTSATAMIAFRQIQIPQQIEMSEEKEVWQGLNFAPPENVETTLATLKRLKLWGEPEMTDRAKAGKGATTASGSAANATNKPVISWQLVGIIQQGQQRYVLLLDNTTQKISTHYVTNKLPDEANLIAIHDDAIEIKREEKVETLRLYQ